MHIEWLILCKYVTPLIELNCKWSLLVRWIIPRRICLQEHLQGASSSSICVMLWTRSFMKTKKVVWSIHFPGTCQLHNEVFSTFDTSWCWSKGKYTSTKFHFRSGSSVTSFGYCEHDETIQLNEEVWVFGCVQKTIC